MKRLLLLLVVAVVGGCGTVLPSPSTTASVAAINARLDTPDGVVGVRTTGTAVSLILGNEDTGPQPAQMGQGSVHLFSLSGETGRVYNSFVFGTAPMNASRVELVGLDAIGGTVDNGVYVLALRDKDVLPTRLIWRFRNAVGSVLQSGTNITQ